MSSTNSADVIEGATSGPGAVAPGTISLRNVSQRYGKGADEVTAVGPVDLDIPSGEFLVLVGASGCGKSTLLRLIAGFESATVGELSLIHI